jgi:hypothetical protein
MGRTGKVRYSLETMARRQMWPTPMMPNGGRSVKHVDKWKGRTAYHQGKKVQVDLAAAVRMWPTPLARDYKTPGMSKERLATRGPDNLTSAMRMTEGTGALNPTWVEWLMGFPSEWTVLDASAMPSSRRSRKSSGAQS